ncbi:hypothetical protein JEQ12_016297 [Ovis aries]|uniref:Uncharacterized protein n=1 Tax=Ovis aries TaxID=9940 RepID=A0A836D2M8_SHEEP|nr:hypothetical protein JEQ12_016297 [Ovis aries]
MARMLVLSERRAEDAFGGRLSTRMALQLLPAADSPRLLDPHRVPDSPPEQPLGPSSTRKRNSISVLLDSPGPYELSVALLRPWLSIIEVWLSREFFCLYEEKSEGERTLTGCLTYFQDHQVIFRFAGCFLLIESSQGRGQREKASSLVINKGKNHVVKASSSIEMRASIEDVKHCYKDQ